MTIGEYIRSGQGTTRGIYGDIQSSAVDGRSPYVTSNYGTVDTLQLQDGQQVRVSAVDGDSPYIVTRSNPHCHCAHARSNGTEAANTAIMSFIFAVPAAVLVGGIWGFVRGKSGK